MVFRNDPLESLRVSSTFDSIPFIKDYLQKEIERVVRGLFQEELPVGIHRLSLKWFNPEYAASLEAENNANSNTQPATHSLTGESEDESAASPYINPLAPSPEEPNQQQFSRKHMEQLETLLGSQKTLSVVSSSVTEAVFRAWAAPSMVPAWSNGGFGWTDPPLTPSPAGGATTYNFTDTGDAISVTGAHPGRSSLSSSASSMSVPGIGTGSGTSVVGGRLGRGRKKKHRIVNLRRKTESDSVTISSVASESTADLTGSTAPTVYSDEYVGTDGSVVMEEDESDTQHYPVKARGGSTNIHRHMPLGTSPPSSQHLVAPPMMRDASTDSIKSTARRNTSPVASSVPSTSSSGVHRASRRDTSHITPSSNTSVHECRCRHSHSQSEQHLPNPWLHLASMVGAGGGGSILEQAVLMKLAGEVARLQAREKEREMEKERTGNGLMVDAEAPPAYGV